MLSFLMWLVWRKRIKTAVFLKETGILNSGENTFCSFCNEEEEDLDHLLLHYVVTWKIWTEVLKWWGIQWVVPSSVAELFGWWIGFRFSGLEKEIWKVIHAVALWCIWVKRNKCKFNGAILVWEEVCDLIKVKVSMWIKFGSKSVNYSINELCQNLKAIRGCD